MATILKLPFETKAKKKKKVENMKGKLVYKSLNYDKPFYQKEHCLKNKNVSKERKQMKNKRKIPLIRKTEFDNGLRIFTEEQEQRLQLIDNLSYEELKNACDLYFLEYGKKPSSQTSMDRISLQFSSKQNLLEQIQQWANNGIKKEITKTLGERQKEKMIDLLRNDCGKDIRKQKKAKGSMNFVVKHRSPSINCGQKFQPVKMRIKKKKGYSHDKMKTVGARIISQFETSKYIEYAEAKKFPPLKKLFHRKMNENLMKRMNRKQQFSQLHSELVQKYLNFPESNLMTLERKQALFECETIKGVQDLLTRKEFERIGFFYEQEPSKQSLNLVNFFSYPEQIESSKRTAADQKDLDEIEKQLEKNRLRLRLQRKRKIQKLKW